MSSIWIPGAGTVPLHARQAAKVVRDYDPDLALGRNEQGGWAVFLERGSKEPPFPVFELGHELPPADAIQRKLYMSDVRRRGRQIVDDIERRRAAQIKELDDRSHDAAGEVAEVVEWATRKDGYRTDGRIFVGKGISK
jgi:hypothetical protein